MVHSTSNTDKHIVNNEIAFSSESLERKYFLKVRSNLSLFCHTTYYFTLYKLTYVLSIVARLELYRLLHAYYIGVIQTEIMKF